MGVLESFSLQGKTALVTGGAGIYGQQIVRALAEAGAKTFTASRNLENGEQFAAQCRSDELEVIALELDQADERSIKATLTAICEMSDGVDVLINNAVARPMESWSDPVDRWEDSLRVNATGVFMMTRTFGDHMAERGGGSIVNIGSIQGVVGPDLSLYQGGMQPGPPDYAFHKGGMVLLTRYAASFLGPQGVRVNCISPGGYDPSLSEDFVERYSTRTFLGRMGNETDLKGIIVFLASDASSYITGANIPVDGGYTAK